MSGLKGGAPPTKKGDEKKKPLSRTDQIMANSRKVLADRAVPETKKEPEKKKELEKKKKEKPSGPLGDFTDFYNLNDGLSDCSGFSSQSKVAQDHSRTTTAASSDVFSDVSSLNASPPGFTYDKEYEKYEFDSPQLSSLAVRNAPATATSTATSSVDTVDPPPGFSLPRFQVDASLSSIQSPPVAAISDTRSNTVGQEQRNTPVVREPTGQKPPEYPDHRIQDCSVKQHNTNVMESPSSIGSTEPEPKKMKMKVSKIYNLFRGGNCIISTCLVHSHWSRASECCCASNLLP